MAHNVTFHQTELQDLLLIEHRTFGDSRGFFMEAYSQRVWEDEGLACQFVQDNLSSSAAGTVRGLHYQIEPHAQGKLVRAITGAAFDVAVDLRRGSPTFGKWAGYTLSGENHLALWVPAGFAHGFQALEDDTRIYYKSTGFYAPQFERGIRFDDPAIGVEWPQEPRNLSDKDRTAPLLRDAEYNFTYVPSASA